MNPFDLTGKVLIVTGGSGFLGMQYQDALRAAGATVLNFDVATGVDITEVTSVEEAVAKVLAEHGRIDGLITNAALNPKADEGQEGNAWAPYSEFDPELFRAEIDVNLTGSFLPARAVARQMIKQKSGSIVFIASDLAFIAPANHLYAEGKFKDIAYGTSKAGILGLMRFFAAFLGPHGARANALVPGGMLRGHSEEFQRRNGSLNMLGRMAREGEYNGAIQFLLSDASTYMTGSSLIVDGGRTAL